jgi:hypothetical protein
VVGSDGAGRRTGTTPSSLKQHRLSYAQTKYNLIHLINFVIAMNLKVGVKNPRRYLKIISL